MPSDTTGDEIGAPALCPHHRAVVNNLIHLDHVADRESTRVAQHLRRQCPQCRKDQP